MVGTPAAIARRPVSSRSIALLGALAASIFVVARLFHAADVAAIETFVLIFTSIVVEALPFVLTGAAVSALIETYVSDETFARLARLPVPLQLPGAALGGLAFPVCECGSVPVARRLISRGLHPAAGLAFMLSSPIVNPIVLLSTVVAYRGRGIAGEMLVGRAVLGMLLAIVAGWALGSESSRKLLRPRFEDEAEASPSPSSARLPTFVEHLAGDFFFMGRFIVLGAALAALLQTAIPQDIVSGIAEEPLIGALALMAIAFVLSLCSEADAFVAVSFTQFSIGSQLAFLVFGPVLDTKLSFLYGATFRGRFVARLLVVTVPVVLAGALWFEALVG